jgi:uncharacterized caspase-like protein
MHIIRSIALGWVVLALSHISSFAGGRVALVIGNSAYQNAAPLANPARDAAAMAATFRSANFDIVESRTDLSATEMRRTLRDFSDKARDADIAVIYFAGHGIEVDGTNYLIPVDAMLERDTDVYDETFALDRVLVAVESVKRLRLVILDACRDNPFTKTMKRTAASRSIDRGLARVEPASSNTMVAFAAKAGSTALDGDKNSPFASALVKYITRPGLDLRKAFGFVRDDVLKATGNRQEPFVYGSLGGDDVSLVPAPPAATPAPPPANPVNADVRGDYELAERIGTREGWDAFIANYPTGFYADLAKAQRDKLVAEEARVAATERAKAAADEKARLMADGARAAVQAKAAAQAQAAEDARIAAERKKAAEEENVAAAERAKAAALAKASDGKAPDGKVSENKASDDQKITADKNVTSDKPADQGAVLAATNPAATGDAGSGSPAANEIPRLLQAELRRVGCNTGPVDDNWNAAARKSLDLFNKNARTRLDIKAASLDALDVVRSKTARVCPLVCDHGYRADGERCTRITCRSGYEVGDDNTCERVEPRRRSVQREQPVGRSRRMTAVPITSARQQPAGQIICTASGCRPVRSGCRLVIEGYSASNQQSGQAEVCH